MSRRPEIFISATSKDLRSCRQLVRDALLTLGCVPVVQEHFAPDARTVREMLRDRLVACDAVIHLAGECYGHEPRERGPAEARRSYTQMEYDIARELKKPVYTFHCADSFPYDTHEPEPDDLRTLQQQHRAALASRAELYKRVKDPQELNLLVHQLQIRVEHLSRDLQKTRSWLGRGVAVALVALALVGGVTAWLSGRYNAPPAMVPPDPKEMARQAQALQREWEAAIRPTPKPFQPPAGAVALKALRAPPGQVAPKVYESFAEEPFRVRFTLENPPAATRLEYSFDELGYFETPAGPGQNPASFLAQPAGDRLRLRVHRQDDTMLGPFEYAVVPAETLIVGALKERFNSALGQSINCVFVADQIPVTAESEKVSGRPSDPTSVQLRSIASFAKMHNVGLVFVKRAPAVVCLPDSKTPQLPWAAVREVRLGARPGDLPWKSAVASDWLQRRKIGVPDTAAHIYIGQQVLYAEPHEIWNTSLPADIRTVYARFAFRDGTESREVRFTVRDLE